MKKVLDWIKSNSIKCFDCVESKIKKVTKLISSFISSYPAITILIVLAILIGSIILIFYWMFKNVCLSTDGFLLRIFTYLSTPAGSKDYTPSVGTLVERIGYIVGGVIAILVALATFQRAKAADKTAEAQKETAVEQEKGNFQERYKDAVNQLNNNKTSIRLAGFYGLYHLSQDNQKYCKAICDILCGYIRERTTNMITVKVEKTDKTENKFYQEEHTNKPDNEIQIIIDLLTNKKHEENYPFQSEWIDLSRAYLVGANFNKSILNKSILEEAQLQEAVLYHAQLRGAKLKGAQLQGARLSEAQLQGAILYNAQMQGTVLYYAHLQGADLYRAQLQRANLENAQLQGAVLSSAKLQGANLPFAQMQGAILSEAQLQGANLFHAQMQGADLSYAQLQGASSSFAQMQGTSLFNAQMQGASLLDAQLQGALLTATQMQGAVLDRINLQGAITLDYYINIKGVRLLKNRIEKNTNLQDTVFSGGANFKDIENLEKKTQEAETYLKGNSLKDFQNRMKEVIQILHDHKNKDANTNFPPKGYTKISIEDYENPSKEKKDKEKYIITGILDKATADKTIEELKAIEKEVTEIKKKYSTD